MSEMVLCACGCQTEIPAINSQGQPARFAHGHNMRKPKVMIACACGCGTLIPERNKKHDIAQFAHGHNMRGKKWSHKPETLEKIKEVNKAIGATHRGENHHGWKGGISNMSARMRDTRYSPWRLAVLARDAYTCQHCHTTFRKRDPRLDAHHLQGYTAFPELRYEVSNGLTLCNDCHRKVHGKKPRFAPLPLCQCGCGDQVQGWKKDGTPASYLRGHAMKGRIHSPEARAHMQASKDSIRGVPRPPDVVARVTQALRASPNQKGKAARCKARREAAAATE